ELRIFRRADQAMVLEMALAVEIERQPAGRREQPSSDGIVEPAAARNYQVVGEFVGDAVEPVHGAGDEEEGRHEDQGMPERRRRGDRNGDLQPRPDEIEHQLPGPGLAPGLHLVGVHEVRTVPFEKGRYGGKSHVYRSPAGRDEIGNRDIRRNLTWRQNA